MYICKICGKECQNKGMGSHITRIHHITVKEYYDTYMKQPNEEFCNICGKEVTFHKLGIGYSKYCVNCAKQLGLQAIWDKYGGSPAKNTNIQEKMRATCKERYGTDNVFASEYGKLKIKEAILEKYGVEYYSQSDDFHNKVDFKQIGKKTYSHIINDINNYAEEHNLILLTELQDLYGNGWKKYYNPPIIKYKNQRLVDKSYIEKAKIYSEFKQKYKSRSYCEQEIVDYIKSIYNGEIITNSRSIIKPYELDIYLPNVTVAIEENDTFWHSNNPFSRINDYNKYHRDKQELCNKQGITLLYINRKDWLNNNDICKKQIKDIIGSHT